MGCFCQRYKSQWHGQHIQNNVRETPDSIQKAYVYVRDKLSYIELVAVVGLIPFEGSLEQLAEEAC